MKYTKVLVSLLSIAFLASCGGDPTTTNPSTTADTATTTNTTNTTDTNTTATETTPEVTSQGSEEEPVSTYDFDIIPDIPYTHPATLRRIGSDWSDTENNVVVEAFGESLTSYIPYVGRPGFEFVYDEEYGCISIALENATGDDLETYVALAETMGYTVTEDSYYIDSYYALGYYNTDGDGLALSFYLAEGDYLCVDVYHHTYEEPEYVRASWLDDEVAAIDGKYGEGFASQIACVVPEGCELLFDTDYDFFYVSDVHGGPKQALQATTYFEDLEFDYDQEFDEYIQEIPEKGTIRYGAYVEWDGSFMYYFYLLNGSEGQDEDPGYSEGNGNIDIEVQGDYSITAASLKNLPNTFTKGAYGVSSFTLDSISYACNALTFNVQDDDDVIQMKKNESYLYNITPMSALDKIEISIHHNTYGEGALTIYSSVDCETWTKVTGTNGVYDFDGENYFKIANESKNAVYINEVAFTYAK